MKTKIVYQLDGKGFYVGPAEAHESPLEPGVFMIPGGCVEKAPPKCKKGYSPLYNYEDQKWEKIANERIVQTESGVELISEEDAERLWRNAELTRADIEVNKLEDSGLDASAWRAYRVALREYPTTLTERPVAPIED